MCRREVNWKPKFSGPVSDDLRVHLTGRKASSKIPKDLVCCTGYVPEPNLSKVSCERAFILIDCPDCKPINRVDLQDRARSSCLTCRESNSVQVDVATGTMDCSNVVPVSIANADTAKV